jgi:hypothetical protein
MQKERSGKRWIDDQDDERGSQARVRESKVEQRDVGSGYQRVRSCVQRQGLLG